VPNAVLMTGPPLCDPCSSAMIGLGLPAAKV
jgi:hypothetical protein